jgi:hypothetical protein
MELSRVVSFIPEQTPKHHAEGQDQNHIEQDFNTQPTLTIFTNVERNQKIVTILQSHS